MRQFKVFPMPFLLICLVSPLALSGQSRGFGSRGGHVQASPVATSANFVDVVVQLTYSYRIDEKPAQ